TRDIMWDILIVNPSGIPGHNIATDVNMKYMIQEVKELIVVKGLQTTWDQVGNVSAVIAYIKEIKQKIANQLNLPHQNKGHSDVDVSHLNMLTFRPNQTGNNCVTPIHDLLEEGSIKLKSASLSTFNTKFKNFVAGMVIEEENDDLPAFRLSVNEMEIE
ncbi:hypothetical protein BDQ17DRAFT_1260925, partial [Cyathus striatus]